MTTSTEQLRDSMREKDQLHEKVQQAKDDIEQSMFCHFMILGYC